MDIRRPLDLSFAARVSRRPAGDGGADDGARANVRPLAARVAARVRGRHLLVADVAGTAIAAFFALELRYEDPIAPLALAGFLPVVLILTAVRPMVNARLDLYSRRWPFASVPDLLRIAVAIGLGTLLGIAIFYGLALTVAGDWLVGFPRSFWIAEALLSLAFMGGIRFAIRAASDLPSAQLHATGDRRGTLLYGAGRTGALLARSARRQPDAGVVPVGFLDDDPKLVGSIVAGLRVYGGLDALDEAIADTGAQALLITMPSASGEAVRRVVDAAMTHRLDVRTMPSITDLLDGSIDAYRVRHVRVEDLLRRPMVTEHAVNVETIIRGKTVVVTGAGGSIGSELARQVFAFGPRRLVLVDRAESPLYLVQRELEHRREHGRGRGELRVHLANVASRPAMRRLVETEQPDVIFHAAAYKHVPMMEEHPSDAVHVNIGGTLALLDMAAEAGVERFVFVSTDKAVRPSSVMGASKRVAEMLVADAARRTGRPYVSVRFGNVLGSNGSVVPIFQEQIEHGQPLTITHPDMTRYFMTIPEAAWLILDAAALGTDGDLFVLDMGEPVRVLDLARDLVRLSGRSPEAQPIEVVGLRPGEKLHEELFYDVETVEPTASAKVLRAIAPPPPHDVRSVVFELLQLANGEHEASLAAGLMGYVASEGDGHAVAEEETPEHHRTSVPLVALHIGASEPVGAHSTIVH